jgi:type II secretory pathway component PulC
MSLTRISIIAATVAICGVFLGSAVIQLAVAHAMPLTPRPIPPLPEVQLREPVEPIPIGEETEVVEPPPVVRPVAACPSYRVVGSVLVRDAPGSFAAIHTSTGASLIQPGMSIEGFTVDAIDGDRLVLRDGEGRECEAQAAATEVAAPPEPAELAPGQQVRVPRSALASDELSRLRAIPDANGIRIFGVRRGGLAEQLGLRNGDRITAIDGQPLRSPDEALQAYARAMAGERLRITIERRGTTIEIVASLEA